MGQSHQPKWIQVTLDGYAGSDNSHSFVYILVTVGEEMVEEKEQTETTEKHNCNEIIVGINKTVNANDSHADDEKYQRTI